MIKFKRRRSVTGSGSRATAAPSPSGKGAKQVAGTTRAATAKATTTATTRVAKGPESTRKTVQKPARVEATAALSPSGKGKTVAVAPSPREQSKPIAEGSRTATTAVAEALSPRAKGKAAAESSRAATAAPSPSIRENRSWFIRLLDAINPIGTVEAEELPIQAGSPQAAVGVSRELTPSQRAELGATLRQAGYPESLRQAAELQDDAGEVTWQSRQDREFYARLDAMDLTLDRSRPGLFSPSRRSYLTGNPSDRRSYLTEAPSGRRYNSWLGNIGLLGTGLSAGVAANMVLKTVARAFPATTIAAIAMQLESQVAHYAAINPDLISQDHDFIPSPGRWDRDFAASQARLHRVAQEQTEHPIRDFYAEIPERVVDAYHEQPFELGFGVGFVGDLVRPVVGGAARSVNAGMLRLFDLNRARQAAIADSAATGELECVLQQVPQLRERLTKQRLIQYLEHIHEVPREQLVRDIEAIGLKLAKGSGDGRFVKFRHKTTEIRVQIHEPHWKRLNGAKYSHIHIKDTQGRALNIELTPVDPSSADAHIRVQDLAKLFLKGALK